MEQMVRPTLDHLILHRGTLAYANSDRILIHSQSWPVDYQFDVPLALFRNMYRTILTLRTGSPADILPLPVMNDVTDDQVHRRLTNLQLKM